MRVPQTLRAERVELLAELLRSPRVEEEFDLWMWTAVRLLKARGRVEDFIVGVVFLAWKL